MSQILITGKSIVYSPPFWVTFFTLIISYLLYRINKRTFRLLYKKPYIHIKNISVARKHKGPSGMGMIPDGTYIDMEIINPSSLQNVILNIKISFFPFIAPVIQNEANIKIDP